MQADGAYPDVLWQLADAMATGATIRGGIDMSVRDSYSGSLGCATR